MNIVTYKNHSKYIYFIYAFIACAFVLIFSFNTSPFYLGYAGDTSAYKQMGLLILQGGTPYVDLYDNKGLILYLFNALGIWISPQWGICMLQCIMMTCTLIVWDKLLDTIGTRYRLFYILSALIILFCYYEGGDMTEDFCLFYISIPLLFYFKSYYNKTDITPLQYFIVGLCFGIIIFVRMNNALSFLFFYLFVIIADIQNKRYAAFIKNMAAALAGFSIITIGCILTMVWIGGWQSLDNMLYWMIGVNFERLVLSVDNGWDFSSFCMMLIPMSLLLIYTIIIFFKEQKTNLILPFLLTQLTTLISAALRPFPHYAGILTTIYMIIISIGFKHNKWTYIVYFMTLLSFNHRLIYDNVMRFRREIFLDRIWFKEAYDNFHNATLQMSESEKAKIFNFEYWPGLGLLNREGIVQYNKNTLTGLNEEFSSMIQKDSIDNLPRWIITSNNSTIDSNNNAFISQHYTRTIDIGTTSWRDLKLVGLDTSTFE